MTGNTTGALPPAPTDHQPNRSPHRTPWLLATLLVGGAMIALLRWEGRPWWCHCGQLSLWIGDVNSSHNSQHLFDPYSFTHVLHGIPLCGILAWAVPRLAWRWRFWCTWTFEAAWEVAENSNWIIDRYRTATIALGYTGDSVINSLSDLACCAAGFLLASRLGWRWSAVLFVAVELLLLVWIRDNLTLNVLMLLFPSESIKAWQSAV